VVFFRRHSWLTVVVFMLACLFLPGNGKAEEKAGPSMVHHDLWVRIVPGESHISVVDTVTIPDTYGNKPEFALHGGLRLLSPSPGVTIHEIDHEENDVPVTVYMLEMDGKSRTVTLVYEGEIYHPLEQRGEEYARDFRETPGMIADRGVVLSGSSHWYPFFDGGLVSFSLEAEVPPGWEAVSQGELVVDVKKKKNDVMRWVSPDPQDEIFLIAARFRRYSSHAGKVISMVYLREPDEALAAKYLEATDRYIAMYEDLIGPYPYAKFALIENFWETGYGMPSFTLLGPKIIRFPFIIVSSYPHEILHNWWGNSVYPEYLHGNWSEGLTAYLSDHLLKEQQGNGTEYRQTTLQKYADYVLQERDFPLTDFRSRHSSSSEAIGYGKSLMFFHMLRRLIGDEAFRRGLQEFYREKKFGFASFDDIRSVFEKVSGMDLDGFFDQWTKRTGAPKIELEKAELNKNDEAFELSFRVVQVQKGKPYSLRVPVAVTLDGQERAWQGTIDMDTREKDVRLKFMARPLRIDLDPEFDLFRKLDRDEVPPALSQVFGARKMLIVLPAAKSHGLADGYARMAEFLKGTGPGNVEVVHDDLLKRLPADRSVIVLGWENYFASDLLSSLVKYDITFKNGSIHIQSSTVPEEGHAVVFVIRNAAEKDQAIAFIAADTPEALEGLGRKLPHYHKYSYLVFEGDEPRNVLKGRWPVTGSPMISPIDGMSAPGGLPVMGKLSKREPLITLPSVFSSERMMETVRFLSDANLQGRGYGTPGLEKTAEYISGAFMKAGLVPAGDKEGSYYQEWKEGPVDGKGPVTLKNIIGMVPGVSEEHSGQCMVIGAHYDHLGTGWPDARKEYAGKVYPGADDNASGIAVLIELARVLKQNLKPDRTLIFAAFTAEEEGRLGSGYFVENFKRVPVSKCIGMVNIDTVGRLDKKKLMVLGGSSAREWVHIFRGAGYVTGVDIELVTEELDSSDQTSFQNVGVPAVQVFTGPHTDYHRPSDTAERIDEEGLVKVASVVKEVVEYLSGKDAVLSRTSGGNKGTRISGKPVSKRKVSLGTVPDFGYSGDGCRITDVLPGSPAENCGMQKGDVIMTINDHSIKGLKGFSEVLRSLKPGSRVIIRVLRDGKELELETILEER